MPSDLSSLTDEELQVIVDKGKKTTTKVQETPQEIKKPVFGPTEEEWKTKYESSPFGSTIGKVLDIPYKGAQEFAQGAKDLFTPGSRLHGAHEMFQGALGATSPVTAPLAIMNPATALTTIAGSEAGGAAGKYGARAFEAPQDVQDVSEDLGNIIGGGIGGGVSNFSNSLKGAYRGFMDTPMHSSGLMSPWLRTLAGREIGSLAGPVGKEVGTGVGLFAPKIAGGARGAVEGFKGPVESPNPAALRLDEVIKPQPQGEIPPIPEPSPQKGPSLGMLREQLKSGVIQPEDFAQKVQSLGYDPETTANIIKQGSMSVSPPAAKLTVGQTPKALSLGHLQEAVKSGLMDIKDFPTELEKLGYDERDRGIIAKLLEKKMEEEAAAEKEEIEKPEPEKKPAPKKSKEDKVEKYRKETIGKVEALKKSVSKNKPSSPSE